MMINRRVQGRRTRLLCSVAGVAVALCGASVPSFAQQGAAATQSLENTAPPQRTRTISRSSDGNVLEQIVVTASRRRSEDVQRTPIAVTAISSAALTQRHIVNFQQIGALAPNLQVEHSLGSAGVADVYLRGFGENTNDPAVDPHVAIFVDGIYQPAPVGTTFDLFDIDQVEVDAGPQGTLAGKNAPVGAIYVSTAKATDKPSAEIQADYGRYDAYGLRAIVNGPLWQHDGRTILAGKFSVVDVGGGNWAYNVYNNKRDFGGNRDQAYRAALAFTPIDALRWDLIATIEHNHGEQAPAYQAGFLGGSAGSSQTAVQLPPYACFLIGASACEKRPYGVVDESFTTRPRFDHENISSTISYKLAPVTLTLINGYVGLWQDDNLDVAGTPYVALNAYDDKTTFDQESAEFRISSNKGGGADLGGRIDWVAGGYYSTYDYTFENNLGIGVLDGFQLPVGVANVRELQKGRTQSEAGYMHVIGNITNKWTATFGVRESFDEKHHSFLPQPGTPFLVDNPESFHNSSFEAGTAYKIDNLRLVYFRFAEGYESGGFGGLAIGDNYRPELNKAYEIGFKSDWLNRHLRVNGDLFRNDLSNLQVESAVRIPTPPGFLQETLNAGAAQSQGAEVQIIAVPTDALTTHMNVGYLDTHYSQNQSTVCSNDAGVPADCSGLSFAYAPKWTIDFGAQYTLDLPHERGSFVLSGDFNYKSHLFTQDPPYPSSYQPGYGLLSADLAYHDPSGHYVIDAYGSNILNRRYLSAYSDPSGLAAWELQGRPAEWGIRVTGKF